MPTIVSSATLAASGAGHQRADIQDMIARALLIALMILTAQGCWERMAQLSTSFTAPRLLDFLSEVGILMFAALVSILTVIRLPARRGASGWGAMVSALGGAFALTLINQTPVVSLPWGLSLLSASLLAIGNIATVYCLMHLGRSFSVLPQARALVRSGPYAYLRHPLYVAEAIATIGMLLPHFGWLGVAVGAAQFGFQWRRIFYEEAILSATFADYAGYAAVTPRFIPCWPREK